MSRFSHHGTNNAELLGRIDVKRCIEERQDLFADRIWAVVGSDDRPGHVETDLDLFSVRIIASPP